MRIKGMKILSHRSSQFPHALSSNSRIITHANAGAFDLVKLLLCTITNIMQ
jgi:hypothetical protein